MSLSFKRSGLERSKTSLGRLAAQIVPIIILFALPLTLPFVRRLTPVAITFAALIAVIWLPRIARIDLRVWWQRPDWLVALLILLMAVSTAWSPWPVRGWQTLGSFVVMLGVHHIFQTMQSELTRERTQLYLAGAIAAGSAFMLGDLLSGGTFIEKHYGEGASYRYNMVLVSYLVMAWPLMAFVSRRTFALSLLALVLFGFTICVGQSETAKLAALVGVSAYLVTLALPRLSKPVMLAALFACWTTGFWIEHLAPMLRGLVPSLWEGGHAVERLEIWSAFAKMALEGLPFGWGLEAGAGASKTVYFAAADEPTKILLDKLHPHNNAIQLLLELGWAGYVLSFAVVAVFLCGLKPADRVEAAQRTALVLVVLVVMTISHGVWQMWFWASVIAGGFGLRRFRVSV